MKHVVAAVIVMFSVAAHAHGFRFEGGTGSNADIVLSGMLAAAATDTTMVVQKGYYGTSVFKEDAIAAIRCASQSSTQFSCLVAMKHDRPLDAMETYPLGGSIDPYGDAKSNSAMLVQILTQRSLQDKSVELLSLSNGVTISRDSDDASISCSDAKDAAGVVTTKCHLEHAQ